MYASSDRSVGQVRFVCIYRVVWSDILENMLENMLARSPYTVFLGETYHYWRWNIRTVCQHTSTGFRQSKVPVVHVPERVAEQAALICGTKETASNLTHGRQEELIEYLQWQDIQQGRL